MKRLILSALLAGLCGSAAAQVPVTGAGIGASRGGGGGSQSVWNPSDKNASVTLSTTNITNDTATTAASSWVGVRGSTSYSTGTSHKVVFAITGAGVDGNDGWMGGLADSTTSLSSYLGASGVSLGIQTAITGGGCSPGICTYASGGVTIEDQTCHITANGQTMYLAINFNNGHVFCGIGCSTWANSGNPDSDTGYMATLAGSTTYFAAWAGIEIASIAPAGVINTAPFLGGCSNVSSFGQWG